MPVKEPGRPRKEFTTVQLRVPAPVAKTFRMLAALRGEDQSDVAMSFLPLFERQLKKELKGNKVSESKGRSG